MITWDFPSERHGDILKFEFLSKLGCPPAPQPIPVACPPDNAENLRYSGMELSFKLDDLKPYTAYAALVRVYNSEGKKLIRVHES